MSLASGYQFRRAGYPAKSVVFSYSMSCRMELMPNGLMAPGWAFRSNPPFFPE